MDRIDPDDAIFIATALATPGSSIWSDDKDFEKQDRIHILKTKDILEDDTYDKVFGYR
ncbi:MAG: PIN domain-containing protein [archaeon]